MALLRRYAPQLPLRIHDIARARGGVLVPHVDCHPRQDNWQGVPLHRRFRVTAYLGVAATERGAAGSSTAKKNLILQRSARGQPRLFCSLTDYCTDGGDGGPDDGTISFAMARNGLQVALAANDRQKMLDNLGALKVIAGDKDYYDIESKAIDLLLTIVSPLAYLSGGKHGRGRQHLDEDVVKESLAATCLLLRNAPAEIGATLCSEISQAKGVKTSLERIRDCADEEVRKLAKEILTQLLLSAPN